VLSQRNRWRLDVLLDFHRSSLCLSQGSRRRFVIGSLSFSTEKPPPARQEGQHSKGEDKEEWMLKVIHPLLLEINEMSII